MTIYRVEITHNPENDPWGWTARVSDTATPEENVGASRPVLRIEQGSSLAEVTHHARAWVVKHNAPRVAPVTFYVDESGRDAAAPDAHSVKA